MGKQQNALAKYNLRANRKINGWTLSKKLGSGGNGEVWMCKNDKKEEYAIKFFKFGRYGAAYERFVDEVLFMEQHQGIHCKSRFFRRAIIPYRFLRWPFLRKGPSSFGGLL